MNEQVKIHAYMYLRREWKKYNLGTKVLQKSTLIRVYIISL